MSEKPPLSLPSDPFQISTPFEGDQLGREVLATRLTGYVDRLKAGAVLGIDAPWGEGKTWFGRHWARKLEIDHKVAFIDAFENDYVDDPFALIASELSILLEDAEGGGATLRKKAASVMKALVPMGTKALINLAGRVFVGSTDLSSEIGDSIKSATESASDVAEKWIETRIEAMAMERASLKGFRLALGEAARKSDRPVVVFIDELDRCKPTFAVTLIERIKHLFDVPNLVFVLLLNRRQLEFAIEGHYGQGTDGQAYLGKFVNLWFDLPRPASVDGRSDDRHDAYAQQVLERYGLPQASRAFVGNFKTDVVFWAGALRMSLRDIDRMCALFVLADDTYSSFLSYLIAIKVKYPDRFSRLRRGEVDTHLLCSKELEALIKDKSEPKPTRWPDNMLKGLSECHQIEAGTLAQSNDLTISAHRSDIFGRFVSEDFGQILRKNANRLDLPIESF